MTDIILPSDANVEGDNLWSDVWSNDHAIQDVVNGDLTDGNIAPGAEINGTKLLAGSIPPEKLAGSIPPSKLAPSTAFAFNLIDQNVSGGTTTDITNLSVSLAAGTWLVIQSVGIGSDSAGAGNLILATAGNSAQASVPWRLAADTVTSTPTLTILTPSSTTTYKGRIQVTTGFGATVKGASTIVAVRLG